MAATSMFGIFSILMAFSSRHQSGHSVQANIYLVDDVEGYGRDFDGIGGISGGGATSKLLINYPLQQRNEIMDYLFKPFFGASLQILKVEIGGDAQSTDGTESSHMHIENEENFETGYEWFLMKEAKKRNPEIKLGALAWAFPGWVGEIPRKPYANFTKLAHYLTTWLVGAKKRYDLDIDYIGIWNEQECNKDFVKYFRAYLNERGFERMKIVAPDSYDLEWKVTKQMRDDKDFHEAVDIIGEHYPGTKSTNEAKYTGKTLWSSEDYSTFNDRIGAGCWARILNQNYVNGYMSATLSWNLIYSYYEGLPYGGCGLMNANTPWSGHYYVSLPIWVTAHTTHFAQPNWKYLKHGRGVGKLDAGGSYVTLTSSFGIKTNGTGDNPTTTSSTGNHLTIVIETMTYHNSKCIRPTLDPYEVADWQLVQFMLGGTFKTLKTLNVWRTDLSSELAEERERPVFEKIQPISVDNGLVTIEIQANNLYTLTTVERDPPVSYENIPLPKPFPIPYFDDFEDYIEFSEPYNVAPQVGVFEVRSIKSDTHLQKNKVAAQVVEKTPIHWCMGNKFAMPSPSAFIGDFKWSNVEVSIDVQWPLSHSIRSTGTSDLTLSSTTHVSSLTTVLDAETPSDDSKQEPYPAAYIAGRVDRGGCETLKSEGIFFWIKPSKSEYQVTADLKAKKTLFTGTIGNFEPHKLNKITLIIKDNHATGYINKVLTFSGNISNANSKHGFVAFGTWDYSKVYFDNLNISRAEITSVPSSRISSFLSHLF